MIKEIGKSFFATITRISPKVSASLLYACRIKKLPNIKTPSNFNEKMTKLKLENYNKNENISKLADKYEVRKYVEEKGYGKILNELYGVYDNFDEIDFKKLPNKFAIKCTHGCAYNVICKDKEKLDIKKTEKKVNKWMKEKYGYATQELHYLKIKPKIIVEKYLCDENDILPLDYKLYCFNGKVECIMVCSEREQKIRLSYYDRNWKRVNYEKSKWSASEDIKKPENLEEMIICAEKLSEGFPFVRVDLYNDKGKIIFGELTFTPACCCSPRLSQEGNDTLGNLLKI